jgi:hypothetical protein
MTLTIWSNSRLIICIVKIFIFTNNHNNDFLHKKSRFMVMFHIHKDTTCGTKQFIGNINHLYYTNFFSETRLINLMFCFELCCLLTFHYSMILTNFLKNVVHFISLSVFQMHYCYAYIKHRKEVLCF